MVRKGLWQQWHELLVGIGMYCMHRDALQHGIRTWVVIFLGLMEKGCGLVAEVRKCTGCVGMAVFPCGSMFEGAKKRGEATFLFDARTSMVCVSVFFLVFGLRTGLLMLYVCWIYWVCYWGGIEGSGCMRVLVVGCKGLPRSHFWSLIDSQSVLLQRSDLRGEILGSEGLLFCRDACLEE